MQSSRATVFAGFQFCNAAYQRPETLNARSLERMRSTVQTSECRTREQWAGGLFELRIMAAEGISRVFYCTVVGRRIVFLHQFVKKTENPAEGASDRAAQNEGCHR
jgi:phage-related protein